MKKFLSLILFIFASSYMFAQSIPEKSTANFYLTSPQEFLGDEVELSIIAAKPTSHAPENGFVCFECATANGTESGGTILAMVPQWKGRQFFADYAKPASEKSKAKSLKARFAVYTWQDGSREYVVICD